MSIPAARKMIKLWYSLENVSRPSLLLVLCFQCHILVGCLASFFNQVREPTQPSDLVEMPFY